MTPTERFERARNVLLQNREDLDRARAEFKWPELGEFNGKLAALKTRLEKACLKVAMGI